MEHTLYVVMQLPSVQPKYTTSCRRVGYTFITCIYMLDCAGITMLVSTYEDPENESFDELHTYGIERGDCR